MYSALASHLKRNWRRRRDRPWGGRSHRACSQAEVSGVELRQLLYGRRAGQYRILFLVYDDEDPPVVRVVTIRHAVRDRLTPQDFDEIR